jgi:hypothetical protein
MLCITRSVMSTAGEIPMEQSFPTSEARFGGRIVFLIDESDALRECIAGGTKSKAESIATALNSLLNQLGTAGDLEVAVAGYRGDGKGAHVGCRWGGPLTGRRFVPVAELAAAPLVVEDRVRRLPLPVDGKSEESVRFPIWYVPQLGDSVLPVLGYSYCRHLVVAGTTPETVWSKPPLIISFVGELVPEQVQMAVERVLGLSSPGGSPLVIHVHLGGEWAGRPVLYPSNEIHLPPGPTRDLFGWSSELPEYMIAALREAKLPVSNGARGMIYNASVADLIRMLSLVKAYAQHPGNVAAT